MTGKQIHKGFSHKKYWKTTFSFKMHENLKDSQLKRQDFVSFINFTLEHKSLSLSKCSINLIRKNKSLKFHFFSPQKFLLVKYSGKFPWKSPPAVISVNVFISTVPNQYFLCYRKVRQQSQLRREDYEIA